MSNKSVYIRDNNLYRDALANKTTCTHTCTRMYLHGTHTEDENGFYITFVFLFLMRKINVFIISGLFRLSEMVRSILLFHPDTESACCDSCPQQSV